MKLEGLKAWPVIDSSGQWTVRVNAFSKKYDASAIVPGGTSAGSHEVKVIDSFKAVQRVKALSKKLKGVELGDVDSLINREAGNVSTPISMAVHRLIAKGKRVELFEYFGGKTLPIPFFNVINGGLHAGNKLAFQEYMIAPLSKSFTESVMMGVEVYQALKDYLRSKYGSSAINVGLEGGFAPPFNKVEEPLKVLDKVLTKLGYREEVALALDVAASEFFSKGKYLVNGEKLSTDELIKLYSELVKKYSIVSLEDPFHEEDFFNFSQLREQLKVRVVGDDLTVTNPERVSQAINDKSCNTLLVKVNQVGTVSKAMEAVSLAKSDGWGLMLSHRSRDSCDSFISDLSVGLNAEFIKSGAPARGERVSKYNRLMMIESLLGKRAVFPKKII